MEDRGWRMEDGGWRMEKERKVMKEGSRACKDTEPKGTQSTGETITKSRNLHNIASMNTTK